jgi:ligand-binding sensor domain-containing protein/signal transduction histidine kinase
VLLLVCRPCALALNPSLDIGQYAHKPWKVSEGFTRGVINDVAQTPDGFLWLGTESGLVRFDGVDAVPWEPPKQQPLPSEHVSKLLAARDGTLWVGTVKGLASWKDGKLAWRPELAGQTINAIVEDREGVVWAGSSATLSGRLCAIRKGETRCYGEDGSLGTGVRGLYEDRKGNLWVGVVNGVWRWKPDRPVFHSVPGQIDGIRGLAEGEDGALLIATRAGIRRLADTRIEVYPPAAALPPLMARRVFRDRDGGLWIGTADRGLAHVREGRADQFAKAEGLSGDFIGSIFEDREGNIWVATQDGLDRFRDYAVPTFSVNEGLSSARIGSVLAAQDGGVWLATSNGLNRWENGRVAGRPAPNRDIASLFQDRRGRVWVSTLTAFGYVENDAFHPVSGIPGGFVSFIAEDSAGSLWIANPALGLFRLSPDQRVETIAWSRLLGENPASAVAADSSQGLWLGFSLGGLAYWKDGKVQASYSTGDGLGAGSVGALQIDADGAVWAATEGGLSRWKDGRIATLTQKNGLPCNTTHWAARDDDRAMWLYMACGLVRIPESELDRWTSDPARRVAATLYDSSDGVRIRAASTRYSPRVAKARDGKLWFVQGDGVSVVDPRRLPFNQVPPPVRIEKVVANRVEYGAIAGLRLPPLVRDLEIDYTALSLVAPERSRFRYKLEGHDPEWRNAETRREAVYNDLPPRTYRFRVAACNNSGVWSETGAVLEFTIEPAYYQTSWFLLSCVAAVLTLLGALYHLRLRRLAWRYRMRLEERLAERNRVAQDLHDTLLQGMLSASMHVEIAADSLADDSPARPTLVRALELMRQVIEEGRQALQGLRASDSPSLDLGQALLLVQEEAAAQSKSGKPASFRVVVEGHQRPLRPLLRDELYRIGREALLNAFRHSCAEHVEVQLKYCPDEFRILVKDDGCGVDPHLLVAGRDGHWGLAGMRERAEQIGARLHLSSRAMAGTEVEVSAPAHMAFLDHPTRRWRWRGRRNPAEDAERVR